MKLEESYDSDASEDEEQYSNLLDAVSQLDSTRRIRPATRKEASSVVSEFYLPKETSGCGDLVNANELASVLSNKPSHTLISKRVKNIIQESKTLPKPLEKPVADRIQRSVGYQTVKSEFTKWDPVVEKYRVADHLEFPLHNEKVTLKTSHEFFSQFKTQTPLEMEISKILNGVRDYKDKKDEESDSDENHKFPLTLEEMISKKKEMAQIRAKMSYKEAKAHHRSKIKSKKYHKILKKEKIKKKIKDFEQLQKSDPEAALKKLEELDKTRAKERAFLRHRNTGKWAKNLAIRAKYNKESRKALAEQLKLSKELTQKVKNSANFENASDSESETMEQKGMVTSSENPWAIQVAPEVTDFVTKCKKYLKKANKNKEVQKNEGEINSKQSTKKDLVEQIPSEGRKTQIEDDGAEYSESTDDHNNSITEEIQEEKVDENVDSLRVNSKTCTSRKFHKEPLNLVKEIESRLSEDSKKSATQNIHNDEIDENSRKTELSDDTNPAVLTSTKSPNCMINDSEYKIDNPEKILKTKKKWLYRSLAQSKSEKVSQNSNNAMNKPPNCNGDNEQSPTSDFWLGTDNESEDKTVQEKKKKKKKKGKRKSSADIDELFDELDGAMAAKTLKKLLKSKKKAKLKKKKKNNKNKNKNLDASLKKNPASIRPEIDIEMMETTEKEPENTVGEFAVPKEQETEPPEQDASAEIDPEKFIELKPKKLNTRLPNDVTDEDYLDDEEEIQRMNIAEAFNDDDAVIEFQEKKKEEEESTKCELSNSLPGWGLWGGPDIKVSNKKRKSTFDMSKLPKRKDHNKKDVIICEKANSNIVPHMVKEVPFPFKSVGAFESNIRNPVGREWVPESAHRNLIKTPVETELGKIIEPMDEKELPQFKKVEKSLYKGKYVENNNI